MRHAWLPGLALLLTSPSAASAAEILAVLSSSILPYHRALQDFRDALARFPAPGPKAAEPDAVRTLVLSGADAEAVDSALEERRTDLLLTVGRSALAAVADRGRPPILYVLAPATAPLVRGRSNVTGVEFDVSPRATLAALRDVLPGVRRLGAVFDPSHTGALVAEAQAAAAEGGLSLTALPVSGPHEVAEQLRDLVGKVDALWLLPDLTVAGTQGQDAFVLFSQEHRVPVLAFSRANVERGATLAVSADPEAIAEQAAQMARRLLAGVPPARVPAQPPGRVVVTFNRAVAAKIGVAPNPASGLTLEWVE